MTILDNKTEKLKIEIFNTQLNALKAVSIDYFKKLSSLLWELSCDGMNELSCQFPDDSSLMKLKSKSTYLLELLLDIRQYIDNEIIVEIDSLLENVKKELIKK